MFNDDVVTDIANGVDDFYKKNAQLRPYMLFFERTNITVIGGQPIQHIPRILSGSSISNNMEGILLGYKDMLKYINIILDNYIR